MWGSLSDEHDILLNGRVFRVRNNLYTFLEYASQQLTAASLWIDAICINQSHDEEKAEEVSRMHQVYTGAQEVLVWLGDIVMADHAVRWLRLGTHDTATSLVKKQLHPLYDHGYWNRTWITQEILLARKVIILVGGHVLDWHDVVGPGVYRWEETKGAVKVVKYLQSTWGKFHEGVQLSRSEATNGSTHEYIPFRFWDLFKRRHMSQCTDPRDRIYGLLALVKDEPSSFPISYSEHTTELFWRAGTLFNAWCIPRQIAYLRVAMECSLQELAASAPETVSLPIVYARGGWAEEAPEPIPRFLEKPYLYCRNAHCRSRVPYSGNLRNRYILLCTNSSARVYRHSAESLHCLLLLADPTVGWKNELQLHLPDHPVLLESSPPVELPWHNLQCLDRRATPEKWRSVETVNLHEMSTFVESVNSRDTNQYRLEVSSQFVTDYLGPLLTDVARLRRVLGAHEMIEMVLAKATGA